MRLIASEPQESLCLFLEHWDYKLCLVGAGDQTHALMIARQDFYWLAISLVSKTLSLGYQWPIQFSYKINQNITLAILANWG